MKKITIGVILALFTLSLGQAGFAKRKKATDHALWHLNQSRNSAKKQIKYSSAVMAKRYINRIKFSRNHPKKKYKTRALTALDEAIRFIQNNDFRNAVLKLNVVIRNVKKIKGVVSDYKILRVVKRRLNLLYNHRKNKNYRKNILNYCLKRVESVKNNMNGIKQMILDKIQRAKYHSVNNKIYKMRAELSYAMKEIDKGLKKLRRRR